MMKKLTSALLLAAMLTVSLAACGKAETPPDTTTAPSGAETTTQVTTAVTTENPYDENGYLKDGLPEDLTLNGETVNVYIADYNSAYAVDMYAEQLTGDRLHDTVYHVTASVEERLGVDLAYRTKQFVWADFTNFQAEVTNEILSGTSSFDILFGVHHYAAQMVKNNYFVDLSKTPHVDLTKPWYNQTILDTVMPTDYISFVAGSFSLVNIKSAFAMYYNADLYASLGRTEDLIALVKEGKWTREKLEALTLDAYADLDGDNVADPSDRYGITFGDWNKYCCFPAAFDIEIVGRDDANSFVCRFDSERAVDAVAYLCSLIHDNPTTLPALSSSVADANSYMVDSGGGNRVSKPFMDGNAMFTFSLVGDAATISPNVEFNFGILPTPKWDESQETYQTSLQRSCYALIPTTVQNETAAGAVLEAISSETYRTLVPEYCDVMLKTRYSNSQDVSDMYALILDSIIFDPGVEYSQIIGAPTDTFRASLTNNNPNWSSVIKGMIRVIDKKLGTLIPD